MNAQTILITGSSSGFGFALTKALVSQGYTVFATARNLASANAAAAAALRQAAQGQSGILHLVEMDVTDDNSVDMAIAHIIAESGRIDVVINNAGVGGGGYTETFTPEQFHHTFDVNVFGVQRVLRAVLPMMRANTSGLIITISSSQGRIVIPYAGMYTASKFAVEALSETYRYELAPSGIDVALVEPGGFMTGYWSKLVEGQDKERATNYPDVVTTPDQLWSGVIAGLQSEQSPDITILVEAIIHLISLPAGQRPAHTVVDPLMGGEAPTAINNVSETIQKNLLPALGLGELLTLHMPQI